MKLTYIFMALLLVGMVSALSIDSPVDTTYNTTEISLDITHNETLDSISYTLGNTTVTCTNCSNYSTTLNLTEGEHILLVSGILGNVTLNDSVEFEIELPVINTTENESNTTIDFSLFIDDPESKTYFHSDIDVDVGANTTLDSLYAELDDMNWSCTNCSVLSDSINLSVGNYTLMVQGTLGNITKNLSVGFTIAELVNDTNESIDFSLSINHPLAKTYYYRNVPVDVSANTILDKIFIELGNKNWSCTDCVGLNDAITLAVGDYTIRAHGVLGNITKNVSVNFYIREGNDTEDVPKFTTGFQKLPQMVENGELTDAQLAEIIRSNSLNPGILNRLVKTGMLGNESIDAILQAQTPPPGIFMKVMGWIGFKNTYAARIANTYNLSNETKAKIADRDDVPKREKERIRNELGIEPPGQAKKGNTDSTGKDDDKVPPGQAKKLDASANGNGKVPPGQAKKGK